MRSLLLALALCACHSAAPAPVVTPAPAPTPAPTVTNTAGATQAVTDGPPTIAVVFNSQEIWVGNDDFEVDENATYSGAIHALAEGLERGRSQLPEKSQLMVIGYATGTNILVPLGPASAPTPASLGKQVTYKGQIGTDLVIGLTQGITSLAAANTDRKFLLVIGDGNDTNNEAALAELTKLGDKAKAAHIVIDALIVKSAVSNEGDVIRVIAPKRTTVTFAELVPAIETWFVAAAKP